MKSDDKLEEYLYKLYSKRPKDMDKFACKANQIVKGLWLGNEDAASDSAFMKRHKIGAVLNMTPDVPNFPGIETMRVPVDDQLRQGDFRKMKKYITSMVAFLERVRDIEKKNVLIHCVAGRQRSCTAVLMYLILVHRMPVKKALKLMVTKRPECFHYGTSLNFGPTIVTYLKELGVDLL